VLTGCKVYYGLNRYLKKAPTHFSVEAIDNYLWIKTWVLFIPNHYD